MLDLTILQNFLAALALGALIGLEREYAQYKGRGHSYAGIRTFPLIAVFGTFSLDLNLRNYLDGSLSGCGLFCRCQ